MILKGLLNGNYGHLLLTLFNTLSHNDFEKENEVFSFKFLDSSLKVKYNDEKKTLLPLSSLHPSLNPSIHQFIQRQLKLRYRSPLAPTARSAFAVLAYFPISHRQLKVH